MSTTNQALAGFRKWAREAAYEAVFVYHRTPRTRDPALFEHARKLSDAGLVFLYQQRRGDEWTYCARRTHPAAHHTLDKVSRRVKVRATSDFLTEEGLNGTRGRPRKIRQEIAA